VTFTNDAELGGYASSAWAERGFCKRCATAMFYVLKPTGAYMMSIGSFDAPSPVRCASSRRASAPRTT
jgi:hypothetical protein